MAQEIERRDGFEDMGAQMLKEVASKIRLLTWVLWSHEYSNSFEHGRRMCPPETQKREGFAEALVSPAAEAVPRAHRIGP